MYATTNSRNNSPMYGGNNMPIPTSDIDTTINDQYHWEHSMRAHSHDRTTVTGHSNESLWYSDSVLCQPEQSKRIHNQINVDQSNNSISHKSLNSYQQSLIYSTLHHSTGPRAVIPSKRAAQNRAAQRAFRQRKERYVKDLEKKAKLMDDWKAEIDQLRQQNKELREHNINLEKQIHQQQSFVDFDQQKKLISPIHSPNLTAEIIPAPVVVVLDQPTKKSMRRIKQEPPTLQSKYQASFMPVNLRAPDQTSFIGSPTTSCSSSSSSLNGLEDMPLQPPTFSSNQIPWTTPTLNDLDHYDASLDFMSGEQGLDDLCAILQTRQRPETNNYANNNNTMNYIINEQDSSVHHHHHHHHHQQQQNESMMLARSY